jgi:hypothetical protein
MTRLIAVPVCAAGVILAASAAGAADRQPHHTPLKITIETVNKQRYSTPGDWQVAKDGSIHITVSAMSNQRYEFLVAAHELVEAYLAKEGAPHKLRSTSSTWPTRSAASQVT